MHCLSELQRAEVTHHHEHCRLVDRVLGDADRGREGEGGPQEVDRSEPPPWQLLIHQVAVCRHQRVSEVDWEVAIQLQLSTNLRKIQQCPEKASTRAFSLLKRLLALSQLRIY